MVKGKIVYRLVVIFMLFAIMVTVPFTFTIIRQVDRMITEDEAAGSSFNGGYAARQQNFSSKLVRQIIPYAFYIFFVSLALSIFFARKMLVSLKELRKGAEAMMDGNLDIQLHAKGDDELADVMRIFNQMVAALREKTSDLQKKDLYINAMLDPLWVVDESDLVVDINPAFGRLFGYTREDVLGSSIYDFFDADNAAIVRNQVKDRRERGISSIYEVNIITRDGSSMPVLLSGSPIMSDGRTIGKIGIFKDFREQKELRDEIERSRDYVETVVNSIEDQILVIGSDYRIVTANRVASGNVKGAAIGDYCYSVAHDLNSPCWDEGFDCPARSVFETGRNFRTTHMHTGPEGGMRYHEIVATPLKDSEGNVKQVIELIRDVTDRIAHEEEILLKNRELTALNDIAGLLSGSLKAEEIFLNVLDRMSGMLKMDGGGIFFIDRARRDMTCQYHRGISDEYVRMMGRVRLGEDIAGKVAVTGQIMTTSDISKDARVERSLMKHSGMKGYCCIPVRGKEQVIGVICLFSFRPHVFTSEEEKILNSIGEMTGIALENIQLYEKMRELYDQQRQRRDEEHKQLLSLTTKLGSAVDLRYVIGMAMELIRSMFQADFAWLMVRGGADNFILRASSCSEDIEDRIVYPEGVSSIEGYTAEKRTPVVIPDIQEGARFFIPEEIRNCGYQSVLAVPMQIGDRTAGVFTLFYRSVRDFRDEELHFLRIIANMLAVSMERYDFYVRSISEKGIADTILQSAADGIVTLDIQGRMLAINRAFEHMTGMRPADAIGLPLCDALRYTDQNFDLRMALGENLEDALSGATVSRDTTMVTASGVPITVLISSAPVLGSNGVVTGVVNLLRDISQEKEIDRMKTEIVRSVSHEFRTPLSAIVGMTEMILDGDTDEQRTTQYLQTILSEGIRLSNMVSDLLSIARIESGMERIRPGVVDLKAVIDELLTSLSAAIQKKEAVVSCDLQGRYEVYVDGPKLKQVLLNLIDNALTFSDPGCRLEISAVQTDRGTSVKLKDNGWGIPEEDMPHLRERFYRGRHGDRVKGTGLGLFICSEILRLHGGTMDISSRLGEGTEVTLFIPAKGAL